MVNSVMSNFGPRERCNELAGIGVWDYTMGTDEGHITPVGYCQAWYEYSAAEFSEMFSQYSVQALIDEQEFRRRHKAKYHIIGHKSAEEASACYRQFLIDNCISVVDFDSENPCNKCGVPTKRVVYIGSIPRFRFCADHSLGEYLDKNFVVTTEPPVSTWPGDFHPSSSPL